MGILVGFEVCFELFFGLELFGVFPKEIKVCFWVSGRTGDRRVIQLDAVASNLEQ